MSEGLLNTEKLLKILNDKWINKKCPMCNSEKWQVNSNVYEMREFQQGNLVIRGNSKLFPVVPVVCTNCGNTIFVNPVIIKALKEGE